ncbi:MAG: hypothetical protein M1817_003140 [Caeruleum heppii]|nr:MAG: hypothetical protein M1817_003140 [Caeruleum heppii]
MLFCPLRTLLLSIGLLGCTTLAVPSTVAAFPEQSLQVRQEAGPVKPMPELNANCKGSSSCGFMVAGAACVQAYANFARDASYATYTSFKAGHCTAFYRCDDENEYGADLYGNKTVGSLGGDVLHDLFESIYSQRGCRGCGSIHFGKTCRVTLNYAS